MEDIDLHQRHLHGHCVGKRTRSGRPRHRRSHSPRATKARRARTVRNHRLRSRGYVGHARGGTGRSEGARPSHTRGNRTPSADRRPRSCIRGWRAASTQWLEAIMAEQLFLYGVYSIPCAPDRTQRRALGRRVRNPASRDKRSSLDDRRRRQRSWRRSAEAIAAAHQQAVEDTEHGAGIPKPRAFP